MAEETLLKSLGIKEVEESDNVLPIVNTISESELLSNEIKQDREQADRNFFNSLGTAYGENFSVAALVDGLEKASIPMGKPITNFTPELVKQLTEGLPPIAAEEVLDDAMNSGLATALKQREFALKTLANRKQLEADGWTGVTANAFSVMFDPAEWAIVGGIVAASSAFSPAGGLAALTAGTVKQAYSAKRAFKIGAAATALEAAAFESLRANVKYDIDINDVMIAAGAGALLGGGLNAGRIAFQRAGQRALLASKKVRGIKLTPAEQLFYDEFNVDALSEKIIERELSGESFIESARGINAESFTKLTTEDVEQIPKQAGWNMFGLRQILSAGARTGQSDLAWIRFGGRALGANFTGYKGAKVATNESASEIGERLQGIYRHRLSNMLPRAQKSWKKQTGLPLEDFNRAVSRYVRGIDTVNVPKDVEKVGKEIQRVQNELAALAAAADVSGFSKSLLGKNPFYMSRIFNEDKIQRIVQKYGLADAEKHITQLVETAIRKDQLDIEDKVTKMLKNKGRTVSLDSVNNYINRLAKAYTLSIMSPKRAKKDIPDANEMTLEDLGKIIREEFPKEQMSDEELDIITEILTQNNIPKSHKRARNRLVLNEGTVIKVTNKEGELEDLAFTDLLEEDAEQLVNSYIFQLSGAIGLARNGINTNVPNSSFDDLLTKINDERRTLGLTEDQIKSEKAALQFMYDGITGRLKNREETRNLADMNVALRAYSFAVNMGMSGMSAIMELSNAMFEYGFMTILKSAPAYKQLFQQASEGRLPEGVMRELVETLGIGNEVALGRWNAVTRFDSEEVGDVISPERMGYHKKGSSLRKLGALAEKGAYGAQKNVAYLSGLTGVTQSLRRLSMLHFTNEWALAAAKGKLPFSKIKRQQLGITDEMGNEILKVMKSNLVKKAPNGTVTKLNIDKWKPEVREAFSAMGFKDARTNVQETNIASSNKFLKSTQVGRTMFQFMNFTLGSFEQQTQRLGVRITNKDASVGKILLSAAAMGGLMYVARVQLNAAGRSDADEYIKERMKPENWAIGAISQVGAASMFSYIYQLTTGAMNGNTYAITPPVVSLGQNVIDSAANMAEGDITESEWRKLLRLAPLQSLYGVRQLFNATADSIAN